ncbi:MAG: hypothetical protein NTY48_01700, partial [Candidatus Diapherotrites archaeon]|nr:hypothetical protein [Candidatus Diapherotrites archaeon]
SGASKKIFVAITPGPSALVGDNQKIVIRLDGPVEANATIYFNVKANSFEQGIEILSASSKITMKGNSKAEYRLMVRNNLDVPIDGVAVSIENTPSDINFSQVLIGSLGAEKVVSVIGTISSGDTNGLFSPVFIVSGGDYFNQKSFTLEVLSNPKSNIVSGLFAGLFSLGGINFDSFNQSPFTIDSVFGALLSAILIIIFIAVVIMVIAVVARPAGQKKEVWVRE